jgi:acetylornithine deacetylase/succinyl-diaminopimelate desuccinylase-like protein
MNEILGYIEKNKQRFVDQLAELLKFASVSADPAYKKDIAACAGHVKGMMDELGLKTEIVETAGNPIVYGEYSKPGNKRTLLIYGHYDVQPVDPLELWNKPPFEPLIEGDTIYARGASDDKGQFLIHLLAAEAYLKTKGELPVNIKFVIEGEEETAADNLELFIKENHEKLKADGVVVSDTAMYGRGLPAITYGLRGIAVAEIKVTGPAKDLHSGSFGGSVVNPATEVARIIAGFHDEDYHIRINGFYDAVSPLEDWERVMFASLPFSEGEYLESTGSPATAGRTDLGTSHLRGQRHLRGIPGRRGQDHHSLLGGLQGDHAAGAEPGA